MTDDERAAAFRAGDPDREGYEPIDVAAVRADDALLDALSRGQMPAGGESDGADHQLAAMLAGWRYEIDSRPLPLHPTVDEVEAEIAKVGAASARRTAFRRLRYVAGAAAVAVVAFGAVTVLAEKSAPGDPLWDIKKTMFGSAASATLASSSAQTNMEKAEEALAGGDRDKAAQYVAAARAEVPKLDSADAKQRIQDWAERLAEQVGPTTRGQSAPTGTSRSVTSVPTSPQTVRPTGPTTSSSAPSSPSTTPGADATTELPAPPSQPTVPTAVPPVSPADAQNTPEDQTPAVPAAG